MIIVTGKTQLKRVESHANFISRYSMFGTNQ